MTEPASPFDADQAIALISEKLRVPFSEVRDVYRKEFERLAAQARIRTFLTVLTMGKVRSILRGHLKREELH